MLIYRVENHHFVDPVHKLWREVATSCLNGRALDLLVDFVPPISQTVGSLCAGEADAAVYQLRHLTCAQIGCHDNHAPRKVDATIVTQGQRSFIKYPEQQIPQRIGGLLDLVKEH